MLARIRAFLVGRARVERAHSAAIRMEIAADNLGDQASEFAIALKRFAERSSHA